MKFVFFKKNQDKFIVNKIQIIKYWIGNKNILNILKNHDIKPETFVKKYAFNFYNYYIDMLTEKISIGQTNIVDEFITYLKSKDISFSDLFLICVGLKNALVIYTYDINEASLAIKKEINYVFENDFAIILQKYSQDVNTMEKKLNQTIELLDNNIIMTSTDNNGFITNVSDSFCNISGFRKEELIGKTHNLLRHEDTEEKVLENIYETITIGQVWEGELKYKKKNGSYFWVNLVITTHINKNIIFHDYIMKDITSKKELDIQRITLIKQSKFAAMGEMISMIAHQWKQPLQSIAILVQKLTFKDDIDESISEKFLENIVIEVNKQLDYMSTTIDDFRDFFLPNKQKEFIKVDTLINKAIDFLSIMTKFDSININTKFETNIEINIFVNELVQVLINIIKNSRDVLVERKITNKEIYVNTFEENTSLIIEIEDNAGGVSEEIINDIFEAYFSTKSDKNGTGLGLHMCKIIIEQHCKGQLSVRNSNNGAVFKIELPLG